MKTYKDFTYNKELLPEWFEMSSEQIDDNGEPSAKVKITSSPNKSLEDVNATITFTQQKSRKQLNLVVKQQYLETIFGFDESGKNKRTIDLKSDGSEDEGNTPIYSFYKNRELISFSGESQDEWITITIGDNNVVHYKVQPNTQETSRSTTIVFTQDKTGKTCELTFIQNPSDTKFCFSENQSTTINIIVNSNGTDSQGVQLGVDSCFITKDENIEYIDQHEGNTAYPEHPTFVRYEIDSTTNICTYFVETNNTTEDRNWYCTFEQQFGNPKKKITANFTQQKLGYVFRWDDTSDVEVGDTYETSVLSHDTTEFTSVYRLMSKDSNGKEILFNQEIVEGEDWIRGLGQPAMPSTGEFHVKVSCDKNDEVDRRTAKIKYTQYGSGNVLYMVIIQGGNKEIVTPPFDYLQITYEWESNLTDGIGGVDLDTSTFFDNTTLLLPNSKGELTSLDKYTVGYGQKDNNDGRKPSYKEPAMVEYIKFAGDNRQSGQENVLLQFANILTDENFLELKRRDQQYRNYLDVYVYGTWYNTCYDGNITIRLTAYKGGTMEPEGDYGYKNIGGELVQLGENQEFTLDCTSTGQDGNYPNYTPLYVIHYDINTRQSDFTMLNINKGVFTIKNELITTNSKYAILECLTDSSNVTYLYNDRVKTDNYEYNTLYNTIDIRNSNSNNVTYFNCYIYDETNYKIIFNFSTQPSIRYIYHDGDDGDVQGFEIVEKVNCDGTIIHSNVIEVTNVGDNASIKISFKFKTYLKKNIPNDNNNSFVIKFIKRNATVHEMNYRIENKSKVNLHNWNVIFDGENTLDIHGETLNASNGVATGKIVIPDENLETVYYAIELGGYDDNNEYVKIPLYGYSSYSKGSYYKYSDFCDYFQYKLTT